MTRLVPRFITMSIGALSLAGLAACGSPPTIPNPVQQTEMFSGTVSQGGRSDKVFTVQYAFSPTDATITITSLISAATGLPVTTPIGVGFGQVNTSDNSCIRFAGATQNEVLVNEKKQTPVGFFPLPGNYCFSLFDSGSLQEAVNYVVRVEHF